MMLVLPPSPNPAMRRTLLLPLLALSLVAQSVGPPPPRSSSPVGIDRTSVAVIINTADPLSVAVGEYYARERKIA